MNFLIFEFIGIDINVKQSDLCDKEHFLIPYAFIPTSISVHKTAMNSQDARHFKTFSKGETHCARKIRNGNLQSKVSIFYRQIKSSDYGQ